jgi:hypothetical protein
VSDIQSPAWPAAATSSAPTSIGASRSCCILLTAAHTRAGPGVGSAGVDAGLLEVFLAANLLIAVGSVGSKRSWRVLLLVVVILCAARLVILRLDHPTLAMISLGTWTALGCSHPARPGASPCGPVRQRGAQLRGTERVPAGRDPAVSSTGCCNKRGRPASRSPAGCHARARSTSASSRWPHWVWRYRSPQRRRARPRMLEGVGGQRCLAILIARMVSVYRQSKNEH